MPGTGRFLRAGWDTLNGLQAVQAINSCTQHIVTVTGDFPTRWTGNASIATAANTQINGVAVGTTDNDAQSINMYWGPRADSGGGDCPLSQEAPSAPTNVMKLNCPSSVARAANASCSVSGAPSGTTFNGWQFTDSNNNTVSRSGSNNFSSWSGTMVTGGTVSVTANGTALSASITVTNRNWHTSPASPGEVPNGTFITLPVPPQSTGTDSGLGYSSWKAQYNGPQYSTISDGGPNQGYAYFSTNLTFSTFNYQYEINPDLENTTSTFYQEQCGKNGWILASNLLTQTRRHEYNSSVQSHYAFYSNSLNSNNPGDYVEQQVAAPGANLNTFATNTQSGINSRFSTIQSATAVEPCPVNYSETGTPLGNINYGPSYGSCN